MPGNGESLSSLNGRARPPLATSAASREPSSTPSSRSNRHSRTCRAMQHAHQPLGEARDDRADGTELGFEPRSERRELVTAGQRRGVDDAVVRGRVGAISVRCRDRSCRRCQSPCLRRPDRDRASSSRSGADVAPGSPRLGRCRTTSRVRKWQAAWSRWGRRGSLGRTAAAAVAHAAAAGAKCV